MTKELTDLIPEFNQIQDQNLRLKVLSVWQDALDHGGWAIEDLEQMPYTLLVEDVDITFPMHVSVVCLADVGKLIEFRKEDGEYVWASMYDYLRHPFTGVGLCFKHEIPEAVMHIVATHSWEGDKFKRRPESIIFHHADFTDFHLTKFGAS
jgi:hypothetical protein